MTRDEYLDAHGEDIMRCRRCGRYVVDCDCCASDDVDPSDLEDEDCDGEEE